MVAHAAVDGPTLWLAVDAVPGSLALRGTGHATVVALRSDVTDDQPAFRSVRVDLRELPATDEAAYDVVLVPAGGGTPKPVWARPLPGGGPVRQRVPDDGPDTWDLTRLDDGTLRLVRKRLEPSVVLRHVAVVGEAVLVTTDAPPEGADAELRLVGPDGDLAAAVPMAPAGGGLLRAAISLADLAPGGEMWPLVQVGSLPVRRRRHDLRRPEHATTMPVLFGDDPDVPELRLLFTSEGLLGARLTERQGSAT